MEFFGQTIQTQKWKYQKLISPCALYNECPSWKFQKSIQSWNRGFFIPVDIIMLVTSFIRYQPVSPDSMI